MIRDINAYTWGVTFVEEDRNGFTSSNTLTWDDLDTLYKEKMKVLHGENWRKEYRYINDMLPK